MRIFLILIFFIAFCPILVNAECTKEKVPPFDPVTYYESARGLTGEPLRRALHNIIRNHRKFPKECLRTILEDTDEDPNDTDKLFLMYLEKSVPKIRRDEEKKDEEAWKLEHVWDETHGIQNQEHDANTDVHNIRPADSSVESSRGNKEFDEGGTQHSKCVTCRTDSDSWEPGDTIKGDIARMLFYMDVRYEGEDEGETPDLFLEDRITRKSGRQNPNFGKLCTLVRWHREEPVSDWETRRNDRIYEWQENRNPFIDHPEYVQAIWGPSCPSG